MKRFSMVKDGRRFEARQAGLMLYIIDTSTRTQTGENQYVGSSGWSPVADEACKQWAERLGYTVTDN